MPRSSEHLSMLRGTSCRTAARSSRCVAPSLRPHRAPQRRGGGQAASRIRVSFEAKRVLVDRKPRQRPGRDQPSRRCVGSRPRRSCAAYATVRISGGRVATRRLSATLTRCSTRRTSDSTSPMMAFLAELTERRRGTRQPAVLAPCHHSVRLRMRRPLHRTDEPRPSGNPLPRVPRRPELRSANHQS
jgi:hypothetical protein